jgi:GR25 family glycosyltransferase involved in LPS biosynthesis
MMKHYVITMMNSVPSVTVAKRCIESGAKFDLEIVMAGAVIPEHDPYAIANRMKIPTAQFAERWSRPMNCLAAFLSHHMLWEKSVELDEEVTIFEHDAVVLNPIPDWINYTGCISFGQPSYGKFNTPSLMGVNQLVSKQYFPGAHAYRVKPAAAKILIEEARMSACPADIFLGLSRFPWLQEYFPWPVEARDNFTTIQNENGIIAKHRNGPGYQIL